MKPEIDRVVATGYIEDALAPLITLLEELDEDDRFFQLKEQAKEVLNPIAGDDLDEDFAQDLFDAIIEALNEFSPAFTFFGTEGSLPPKYGYWINIEELAEAEATELVLIVDDWLDVPLDTTGYILLNPNDNEYVLSYRETETDDWEEVWSYYDEENE